jgi:hypothetical protein
MGQRSRDGGCVGREQGEAARSGEEEVGGGASNRKEEEARPRTGLEARVFYRGNLLYDVVKTKRTARIC